MDLPFENDIEFFCYSIKAASMINSVVQQELYQPASSLAALTEKIRVQNNNTQFVSSLSLILIKLAMCFAIYVSALQCFKHLYEYLRVFLLTIVTW